MVKKTAKIAGSIVGGIVGAVALVLIAYAIYVMTAYYRLDDGLALETQAPHNGEQVHPQIERAHTITLVSANVGFGAYGPDFDFLWMEAAGRLLRVQPMFVVIWTGLPKQSKALILMWCFFKRLMSKARAAVM